MVGDTLPDSAGEDAIVLRLWSIRVTMDRIAMTGKAQSEDRFRHVGRSVPRKDADETVVFPQLC